MLYGITLKMEPDSVNCKKLITSKLLTALKNDRLENAQDISLCRIYQTSYTLEMETRKTGGNADMGR